MINVQSQQTQVDYRFVRTQSQRIEAVGERGNRLQPATDTLPDEPSSPLTETVSLTPEQLIKKRLIESLSPKDNYAPEDMPLNALLKALSRGEVNFEQDVAAAFVDRIGPLSADTRLSVTEKRYENESLRYTTSLTFSNEAVENISASLDVRFERELDIERQFTLSAGELKDPLIVNLDGKSRIFGNDTTLFDVDSDGQQDRIPTLNKGTYFLALDRNADGRINNGGELFGANTGNGFAELRTYDEDNNGQIDQRDSIYQALRLWDGQGSLTGLVQSGVSAILLDAQDTPFTFTDTVGNARALLRQTASFVSRRNTLGAVHQVDFVV